MSLNFLLLHVRKGEKVLAGELKIKAEIFFLCVKSQICQFSHKKLSCKHFFKKLNLFQTWKKKFL